MEIDLKIILVQQWHGFGKQGRILPYAATQANPFDAVGSTYLLADILDQFGKCVVETCGNN